MTLLGFAAYIPTMLFHTHLAKGKADPSAMGHVLGEKFIKNMGQSLGADTAGRILNNELVVF